MCAGVGEAVADQDLPPLTLYPVHAWSQVKQQQGHKMLIEKTLEKKDQMESKKRESIMIVSVTQGGGRTL